MPYRTYNYIGTSLFQTPLGLQKMSSIKRTVRISEVDLYTIGTQASVHYTEDVLISEVSTMRGSTVVSCLVPHRPGI